MFNAGERHGRMACSNGQCIDVLKECNSDSYSSDEIYGHLVCGSNGQRYSRCDWIEDCSDGSDEACREYSDKVVCVTYM